ncbi:MAG TPA: hypothetical protein VGX92_11930 [Pyrinomonadaceae bacterium]|jgi:hypothetical protein|nr:hypothetical protein [Pyrinomonadaceae bacterium]
MRRLIFRPLVLLLTFTTGLFLTFLLTAAGDELARLIDEPSQTIPALFCPPATPDSADLCLQSDPREIEEYAVYATLINQLSATEQGGMVIIRDRTMIGLITDDYVEDTTDDYLDDALVEVKTRIPSVEQETFEDFRARSREPHALENLFSAPLRIKVISGPELSDYFSGGPVGWRLLYRRYPDARGILTFSTVGFNREMNQALVYRSFTCGGTCGHGSFVFLVKEGGVWRVRGEALETVS